MAVSFTHSNAVTLAAFLKKEDLMKKIVSDERLDELLELAGQEASKRGEPEPKSASFIPMGEKWKGDGAVYHKKAIGNWIVELIGNTNRGGMVRFWKKAEPSDVVAAEILPHIFNTTPDKKWALQDEVHFMHFVNADEAYAKIKTVKAAEALIWENR